MNPTIPNLPSEGDIYKFALEVIRTIGDRPAVICPIKVGGSQLANKYEKVLKERERKFFKCRRYDLEKGDDYVYDEHRRILIPTDFQICDEEVAVTFDDRAIGGRTQIGAYITLLEAGAKSVLVMTDIDESGVSDIFRVDKFTEKELTNLGPAKYMRAYMPRTYEEMLNKGLIEEISEDELLDTVGGHGKGIITRLESKDSPTDSSDSTDK